MISHLRHSIILLLAVVCLCNCCFSQVVDTPRQVFLNLGIKGWKTSIETPYNLKMKVDIPISVTAGALIIGGFIIKGSKTPLTTLELDSPDISKIPRFDISAIRQSNPTYQTASDILEYIAIALPFLAFVDKRVNGHGLQISAMYLETIAINFALYNMTTAIVDRRRPFTYNTDTSEVPRAARERPGVKESFFSGHTSNAATTTFFGARVFTDIRPHSKMVPFVWIAAAGVPAFTAWSRYKAGKHFPSDVIVGYIVGASVGYLVPTLHKYKYLRNASITPTFENKGLAMTYTF